MAPALPLAADRPWQVERYLQRRNQQTCKVGEAELELVHAFKSTTSCCFPARAAGCVTSGGRLGLATIAKASMESLGNRFKCIWQDSTVPYQTTTLPSYLVGKASPGMMKVVVLGPKLAKKKVRA